MYFHHTSNETTIPSPKDFAVQNLAGAPYKDLSAPEMEQRMAQLSVNWVNEGVCRL